MKSNYTGKPRKYHDLEMAIKNHELLKKMKWHMMDSDFQNEFLRPWDYEQGIEEIFEIS